MLFFFVFITFFNVLDDDAGRKLQIYSKTAIFIDAIVNILDELQPVKLWEKFSFLDKFIVGFCL